MPSPNFREFYLSSVRKYNYRSTTEELGLSTAEIARHLGVATSTVTRAIARGEKLNNA
ncbi:MAG TPA: hypothetical protein ENH30_02840 [Nitrospirae bacterium]|nr:hypothetical protein [Nitrospirota bacterium]